MKKKSLSRRDFLNGMALLGAGSMVKPLDLLAAVPDPKPGAAAAYPPALTGLRGSQPGSYDVPHAVALPPGHEFGEPVAPAEEYDLVVIGAGISGLASAHFYREKIKPDARILILDNHDDFGGHARRNEFTVDGSEYIAYGGSQSMDTPSTYSNVALRLLRDLGIELKRFETAYDQDFFARNGLTTGIFYDAGTFGKSALVRSEFPDRRRANYYSQGLLPGVMAPPDFATQLAQSPLTEAQLAQVREVLAVPKKASDYFNGDDGESRFWKKNYLQFLQEVYGIEDPALVKLLSQPDADDSALVGQMISLEEAVDSRLLGLPPPAFFSDWIGDPKRENDEYIYHFPDGNATVARLLAQRLIPGLAPIQTPDDCVTARFDYAQLDVAGQPVRLRLNSTAIRAENTTDGTRVRYVRDGSVYEATAKHTVMAGWHIMATHILPELSESQKGAMQANLKLPLIYTQVALNQWRPVQKSGVAYAYCPGSYFQFVQTDFPVSYGGFQPKRLPEDPMVLLLTRLPCPLLAAGTVPELAKQGRYEVMGMTLDGYEQQIRFQLTLMFGPFGFDAEKDIAAITVNRWPHGYVWDDAEYEGRPARVLARQTLGRIAIANSDAAGSAYMDSAIDMAWRAVNELQQAG